MSSKSMTNAIFSKHAYKIAQLAIFWFFFKNIINQCHDQIKYTKKD